MKAARLSESCNRYGHTRAEHGTIAALQPAAGSTHRIGQLIEHKSSIPRHAKRLHFSMGWVYLNSNTSPNQFIRPWIPGPRMHIICVKYTCELLLQRLPVSIRPHMNERATMQTCSVETIFSLLRKANGGYKPGAATVDPIMAKIGSMRSAAWASRKGAFICPATL